jgi:hypothetical protein
MRSTNRVRAAVTLLLLPFGCGRAESFSGAEEFRSATCDFNIYWPPKDPDEAAAQSVQPLLKGTLSLVADRHVQGATALRLVVTLRRPSEEADRSHWNSVLAYSNVAWMEEVRVWDAEHKWLWPNLPYLLRLPGKERVERYGGMDPGKHVDNDFAAVLIRKYDASGGAESAETKDSPLVSAEWHPAGAAGADGHAVVHAARSDEFVLHVGKTAGPDRGRVKVWLVYADFLWARPPRTWPKAKEFAGGILAFFEIDWAAAPNRPCQGAVRAKRPQESTGFDWAKWVVRKPDSDRSEAQARLSDAAD